MTKKLTDSFRIISRNIGQRNSLLARSEKGQVLFFFAIIAMMLVILAGTITDYGLTVRKAVKAQTAADAAALAAATWTARAGNLSQTFNGVHWDINYTLAQVITLSADICMIVIIVLYLISLIPFCQWAASAANTLKQIESAVIQACTSVHDVTAPVFDAINSIVTKAAPWIALLHANMSAGNNGASSIEELLLSAVRSIPNLPDTVQDAMDLIDSMMELKNDFFPGLYTWTLSLSSFLPWEVVTAFKKFNYPSNTEFLGHSSDTPDIDGGSSDLDHNYYWTAKHAVNTEWANPYHIDTYAPFTAVNSFWWDKIDDCIWSDSFIIQPSQEFFIKNNIEVPFSDYSFDFNFLDIFSNLGDLISEIFDPLLDALADLFDSIIDKLFGPIIDKIMAILEKIPCIGDADDEPASDTEISEDTGNVMSTIASYTFVVAIKSELGSFLKMFGPVIGEDPENINIPMSFALATAHVRGHPLHPGGLYKKSDGSVKNISMLVVPFWISASPFFTQARLFGGSSTSYGGDMQCKLVPIEFTRKSKKAVTFSKEDGIFKAILKVRKAAKQMKNGLGKKPIPGILLGFNH